MVTIIGHHIYSDKMLLHVKILLVTVLGHHIHSATTECSTVYCASSHHMYSTCSVSDPSPGSARTMRLENQISSSSCTEGYSYGFVTAGVWVDNGCRANFEICYFDVIPTTAESTVKTTTAETITIKSEEITETRGALTELPTTDTRRTKVQTEDLTTITTKELLEEATTTKEETAFADLTTTELITSAPTIETPGAETLNAYYTSHACQCSCVDLNRSLKVIDQNHLHQEIAALKKELLVEKGNLSSTKRKLISVYEDRVTSKVTSAVIIIPVIAVLLFFIVPDILRAFRFLCAFSNPKCCR